MYVRAIPYALYAPYKPYMAYFYPIHTYKLGEQMKLIMSILGGLTVTFLTLYLTIGGILLAIITGTLVLFSLSLSLVGLGMYLNYQSVKLGFNMAIEAQNNNDRWDATKMQSLVKYADSLFKLNGHVKSEDTPLLSDGIEDISFSIQGLDEFQN